MGATTRLSINQIIRRLKQDVLDKKLPGKLFCNLYKTRGLASRVNTIYTAPIPRKTKGVLLRLLAKKDKADMVLGTMARWHMSRTQLKQNVCPLCGGRLTLDKTKRKACTGCGRVF